MYSEKKYDQYIDFKINKICTNQVLSFYTTFLLASRKRQFLLHIERMSHIALTLIMHFVAFGEPSLGEHFCQNFY